MIYTTWPLWAQIAVAPFAFVALIASVLWIDVVWCKLVDRVMRSPLVNRERTWEPTPTRLRIATERHAHGYYCPSCGFPTRDIVVVRLWDDTARVCGECAKDLAPEVAA